MAKPLSALYEMPRPKGALSAPVRGALEKARSFAQPFTAKQFAAWAGESGGTNVNALSIQTILRRMTADRKSGVDQFTPLMVVRPGKPGRGGEGTWQYVYNGTAGIERKPVPTPDEEPEYSADDEWKTVPNDGGATATAEPPPEDFDDDDPTPGEFYGEPEDDDGSNAAPTSAASAPSLWDPDEASSYATSSMERMTDAGKGPDDPIWQKIAATSGQLEAHALIKSTLPPQLQRAALTVAKQIFQNIGKDWEGGSKGEGLLSLYRL